MPDKDIVTQRFPTLAWSSHSLIHRSPKFPGLDGISQVVQTSYVIAWKQTQLQSGRESTSNSPTPPLQDSNVSNAHFSNFSVKSNQVVQSPTGTPPKLLQLQRPDLTSGSSKENGVAGSPRRSFDSSTGSVRNDTSSIHPLKFTWVNASPRRILI